MTSKYCHKQYFETLLFKYVPILFSDFSHLILALLILILVFPIHDSYSIQYFLNLLGQYEVLRFVHHLPLHQKKEKYFIK